MELHTAVEILEDFQAWRLGKKDETKYKPKELTQALIVCIKEMKRVIEIRKSYKGMDDILALSFNDIRAMEETKKSGTNICIHEWRMMADRFDQTFYCKKCGLIIK
jgi:hypothetical protein